MQKEISATNYTKKILRTQQQYVPWRRIAILAHFSCYFILCVRVLASLAK